jgi:hypothetical protein
MSSVFSSFILPTSPSSFMSLYYIQTCDVSKSVRSTIDPTETSHATGQRQAKSGVFSGDWAGWEGFRRVGRRCRAEGIGRMAGTWRERGS